MKKNPQLIAAKRAILNSHYGIDPKPQTFYISSACYSDNTKRMLDELKESFYKCYRAASQWEIIDNSIGVTDWIKDAVKYTQADVDATILALNYYNEIKKQQEETKMDAKKCERCGKLYEMQDADSFIHVYLPGLPVSDWHKENFTESRIRKDNSRTISINLRSGEIVDLCPECREKLKNFFESGDDEKSVAVGLYGETVIKKAEE